MIRRLLLPSLALSIAAACGGTEPCDDDLTCADESAEQAALAPPAFATPVITSLSPASGPPGTVVTIHGQFFMLSGKPVVGVRFGTTNGVDATQFSVVSQNIVVATVPPGATTGRVVLQHRPSGFLTPVTISPMDFVITPAPPSNLAARRTSSSAILLTWRDNSNNETGFDIEENSGAGWRYIGSVAANRTSEPITGLQTTSSFSYRLRAQGTAPSAYSNVAVGPVWRAPIIDISGISGAPSVLRNGRARVVSAYAILDTNLDGVVAGAQSSAPFDANSIFPRWRGNACGVQAGARFAARTNMIMVFEIETGASSERQFVAVHAAFGGSGVTMATMAAGDLMPTNNGNFAHVMGATQQPLHMLTVLTPQGGNLGAVSGTVNGAVFASLCFSDDVLASQISITIPDGIELRNE